VTTGVPVRCLGHFLVLDVGREGVPDAIRVQWGGRDVGLAVEVARSFFFRVAAIQEHIILRGAAIVFQGEGLAFGVCVTRCQSLLSRPVLRENPGRNHVPVRLALVGEIRAGNSRQLCSASPVDCRLQLITSGARTIILVVGHAILWAVVRAIVTAVLTGVLALVHHIGRVL